MDSVFSHLTLVLARILLIQFSESPSSWISDQSPHPSLSISYHFGLPSAKILLSWSTKNLSSFDVALPTLLLGYKSLIFVVFRVEPKFYPLLQNPHCSSASSIKSSLLSLTSVMNNSSLTLHRKDFISFPHQI